MHTSRPRLAALACLLSVALAAVAAPPLPVAGYRGDRNGAYSDAAPPLQWDEASGKNVVWKTRTPNWCYGSPIIVGEKVFVMSEPGWKADFPELACLDIHTGKVLWQREINHLDQSVPDPKRREAIAAAWHSMLERLRMAFGLVNASGLADDAKQAEIAEQVKALGWSSAMKNGKFGNRANGGGYGVLRGWGAGSLPGPDPKLGVTMRDMQNAGLRLETFYGFGVDREGECFSTPASDGQFVYVVTEQGAHACYDLDGNLKWLCWMKPAFNGGGHDDSICRSPVVTDGLFITDLHVDRDTKDKKSGLRAGAIIALKTDTGEVAWQTVMPNEGGRDHGCGSSKVLDIGGSRYFVTSGGHVVRVTDGKNVLSCTYGATADPSNGQTEIAVDDATDTLFYFPGKGQGTVKELVAVKLALDGETLTEQELWRTPVQCAGNTMAIDKGKVYTGGDVVDIATGTATKWGNVRNAPTRWMLAVAGDRLYGLKEDKGNGVARVFDLTGKLLATNTLLMGQEPGDMADQHIAVRGAPDMGFSYACPFTFAGNRMFVRSYDYVYCLGDKAQPYAAGAPAKRAWDSEPRGQGAGRRPTARPCPLTWRNHGARLQVRPIV